MSIDQKGAGTSVRCPTCNFQLSVPENRRSGWSKFLQFVLSADDAAEAKVGATADPDPVITRRSGWSQFLQAVGVIFILGGIIGFAVGWEHSRRKESPGAYIFLAICAAGAIQSFFFAFLIDVFTDIRWFLKKLVDRRNG
jgi:hypothetical protein